MARAKQRGPWARRTYLASTALFAGTLAALGVQVRAGADPAIRPTAVVPRPRLIITRRILTTTISAKKVVHQRGGPVVANGTPVTAPLTRLPATVSRSVAAAGGPSNSSQTGTVTPAVSRSSSAAAPATHGS